MMAETQRCNYNEEYSRGVTFRSRHLVKDDTHSVTVVNDVSE